MLEKYASATKMQPQSSGSLRSNAGIEKGKEIAAKLNIHRIHSQLRGLDSTGRFRRMKALFDPMCLFLKQYTDLLHDLQPLFYAVRVVPKVPLLDLQTYKLKYLDLLTFCTFRAP